MHGDRRNEDGREKKSEDKSLEKSTVIDIRNYKPKRIPQLKRRECMKKIWEVDQEDTDTLEFIRRKG